MGIKLFSGYTLGLAIALSLTACGSNTETVQKLTVTGSSTVAPLASEIAKKFETENSGVRVDVQTGGSSRGLADAAQGLADIGMVSRALKPGEQTKYQSFAIATDGIGIILQSGNPITNLSNQQIIDIYQGKITNWSEVGGIDAEITVVNKAEGRSTLELFLDYFALTNSQIAADIVIGDNQQGIKTVAGNPHAIGYVSIGAAERDISAGVALKLLPLGGIAASSQTLQDGSFPLARPLNLVTTTTPTGLTQEFIQFAQSENVRHLVEAQNLIPITDQNITKKNSPQKLAEAKSR